MASHLPTATRDHGIHALGPTFMIANQVAKEAASNIFPGTHSYYNRRQEKDKSLKSEGSDV